MPVFLIYAGIVHAIGLALLLPMLITLPGPGGGHAPDAAAIDVEIIPGTPASSLRSRRVASDTAALPSAPDPVERRGGRPSPLAEAVANVSPEAEPEASGSRRGAG